MAAPWLDRLLRRKSLSKRLKRIRRRNREEDDEDEVEGGEGGESSWRRAELFTTAGAGKTNSNATMESSCSYTILPCTPMASCT